MKQMKNLYKKNNVKAIMGSVRNPQSQGLMENMNNLISISKRITFTKFMGDMIPKNNLDLNFALKAFIAAVNRKIHLVTKEYPKIAL